jgi:hypothetical protein
MNCIPKRFFKSLFIGTCHRAALRRMSHSKSVPDRLKPQEFERNVGRGKMPSPNISEKGVH